MSYGIALDEKQLRTLLEEGHIERESRPGALYPFHDWVTLNRRGREFARRLLDAEEPPAVN